MTNYLNHVFVVMRSGEAQAATVEAVTMPGISRIKDVKNKIMQAVTAWVKNYNSGQKAWEGSSEDYNIGDLSNDLSNKYLETELEDQGIIDLSISLDRLGQRDWEYDDILVIKDRLYNVEDTNV